MHFVYLFCLISYRYKTTEYNSVNVKLSDSQLSKSKSAKETETRIKLSSNLFGNENDETVTGAD